MPISWSLTAAPVCQKALHPRKFRCNPPFLALPRTRQRRKRRSPGRGEGPNRLISPGVTRLLRPVPQRSPPVAVAVAEGAPVRQERPPSRPPDLMTDAVEGHVRGPASTTGGGRRVSDPSAATGRYSIASVPFRACSVRGDAPRVAAQRRVTATATDLGGSGSGRESRTAASSRQRSLVVSPLADRSMGTQV